MAEGSAKWPRCDYCTFPAKCLGADLAAPQRRCPRCCHRDHITQQHGDPTPAETHLAAEGVSI